MAGSVSERAIIGNLKEPALIAAFATPTKGGSTAVSAVSYLAQQWNAEPVTEFAAEHLYSNARIRPQLITQEDGQRTLQWPTNTVYLARPEGTERALLLLAGVEPSFGWQDLIETIQAFCRRNGIKQAILLHSAPATVSHRRDAQVAAVYGSADLESSFQLPATVFHDGPQSFGSVLSMHLNAEGIETADLIALEPFYTPELPDANAALSLIGALDHHFGTTTSRTDLQSMVEQQRQMYEQMISGSEHLRALLDHLEEPGGPRTLLGNTTTGELEVSDVMDEVGRILSAYESDNG
jgi:predicted ATP-grasp superfamily ATP-dependent carboligase